MKATLALTATVGGMLLIAACGSDASVQGETERSAAEQSAGQSAKQAAAQSADKTAEHAAGQLSAEQLAKQAAEQQVELVFTASARVGLEQFIKDVNSALREAAERADRLIAAEVGK